MFNRPIFRLQFPTQLSLLSPGQAAKSSSVKRVLWVLSGSLGLLIAVGGCGKAPSDTTASTAPASIQPPSPEQALAQAESNPAQELVEETNRTLISAKGIGSAQLGMTLGELKTILGSDAEFTVESPFIVDFDAISVREDNEVQFYILYLAGESFGDEDVIQGLFTDNPKFRTDAGIGPGSSVSQAEETYGEATLSYNTQNESREYVRFAQHPAGNISFATGNANEDTAGIYPTSTEEYHETQDFHENALIQSMLVVCLTEDCAPRTE